MEIDPIEGYSLDDSIKYTYALQCLTTFYSLASIVWSGGLLLLNEAPQSLFILVTIYVLQFLSVIILLKSMSKKPKRWKAWTIFISSWFSGNISLTYTRHEMGFYFSLNIFGIILGLSILLLIFRTHRYLRRMKKTKNSLS